MSAFYHVIVPDLHKVQISTVTGLPPKGIFWARSSILRFREKCLTNSTEIISLEGPLIQINKQNCEGKGKGNQYAGL